MKVVLAGYNIDKSLIDKYINSPQASPEVISAAYARISRSPKAVDVLRHEALGEIEKARSSNQNIIFEMGHASIAEHAVFNIDIIGISRYLTEHIQRSRLASFTEKSQRYVTFQNDFIVPAELSNEHRNEYIDIMHSLFSAYQKSIEQLKQRLQVDFPDLQSRELDTIAKEDARYILPLCTKTQLGMTINARNLEVLLRRLSKLDLDEAKQLHKYLYDSVIDISPSLLRYVEEKPRKQICLKHIQNINKTGTRRSVSLIGYDCSPDDRIVSAIIHESTNLSYVDALTYASNMSPRQKRHFWSELFSETNYWDKMPRAFELSSFTFELIMSQCCWAQFKRHRMCTLLKKNNFTGKSNILPPNVLNYIGKEQWKPLFRKIDNLVAKLNTIHPLLNNYCLTNASPVSVVAKFNLRELYHFVRLRSDLHAQWEIRQLSDKMAGIVKLLSPYATQLLMGKSEFIRKIEKH